MLGSDKYTADIVGVFYMDEGDVKTSREFDT